jgi:hypothetical protein
VPFTTSFAFSPTDTLPLTCPVKMLMLLQAAISVVTLTNRRSGHQHPGRKLRQLGFAHAWWSNPERAIRTSRARVTSAAHIKTSANKNNIPIPGS